MTDGATRNLTLFISLSLLPAFHGADPATTTFSGAGFDAHQATCPFTVYRDWNSEENHFVPEGWMGDTQSIAFDDNFQQDSVRASVIRIAYTPGTPNRWAGIYWWDPPGGDWGRVDGGFDLSCASKLTFWARGEQGGESAEFKVGGLRGDFRDSLAPAVTTGPIRLTREWRQYSIDLAGRDLTHIIGGFVWVTNRDRNPEGAVIYVDDIVYER